MLLSLSPEVPLAKTIFLPSGDHRGPKQPCELVSEMAPPQAGCACTWISCSPVPLAWTTQIELRASGELRPSGMTRCEKTISLPLGDQSPKEVKTVPVGVICRTRRAPTLTTNR